MAVARQQRQHNSAALVAAWWRRGGGGSGSGGSAMAIGGAMATQQELCISLCASAHAILYSNILRRARTTAMTTSNVNDKALCANARQFHIASPSSNDDNDYRQRQTTSVGQQGTRPHAQEHNIFTSRCSMGRRQLSRVLERSLLIIIMKLAVTKKKIIIINY